LGVSQTSINQRESENRRSSESYQESGNCRWCYDAPRCPPYHTPIQHLLATSTILCPHFCYYGFRTN